MNEEDFKNLLIKTIFCCMTSDGNIEQHEIELFYSIFKQYLNIELKENFEEEINKLITEINKKGKIFIVEHLNLLRDIELTEDEKYIIINYIIQMIKADRNVEYNEIMFFKDIVKALNISKESILNKFPDIDPVLLEEDINIKLPFGLFNNILSKELEFNEFNQIKIDDIYKEE
ncbi:MAG TPA: TerB family tellurite resistance protein [Candidatus Hydrogenedens sp.]|nr:TerB family tellurite resistance protein [Candidatus Hydrogenedens sp.]